MFDVRHSTVPIKYTTNYSVIKMLGHCVKVFDLVRVLHNYVAELLRKADETWVSVKPGTHPEHPGTPRNTPEHPRNTPGTPRNTPGTPPEQPGTTPEHPWNIP